MKSKIIIDHIDYTNHSFSIKIEYYENILVPDLDENGIPKLNEKGEMQSKFQEQKVGDNWRCGYTPGMFSKFAFDISQRAPDADVEKALNLIGALWDIDAIEQYNKLIENVT